MDKQGITEIKKTLKPDRTAIDHMVTAFIGHEQDGSTKMLSFKRQRLLAMEDAAVFKYLDIAKATFGGKFDKNLLNIPFSLEAEKEGNEQYRLMKLRESKLCDDELVKEYIMNMADNFASQENLMIVLYHGMYDVPVKTKDNIKLDDSEEVFDFIMASVCPLKLEKPGIYYNSETQSFETINQKLVADKPVMGFMFPAFNDRHTDIHEMLFFTKKADDTHPEFINAVSGQKAPLPADIQKNIFENIVNELVGKATFEDEKALHHTIARAIETRQYNKEDMTVSKNDILDVIKESIADVDEVKFNNTFDTMLDGYDTSDFSLVNLVNTSSFDVEMADVKIKVNPDKTNIIERKKVDGKDVFVIPVYEGGVEVNGKPIE